MRELLLSCVVMRNAILLLASLLFLVSCTFRLINVILSSPSGDTIPFAVELADEPSEWEQGLMFRTNLPEERGMLFVFDEETEHVFWMKNTIIPLDLLFFRGDGSFVSSVTMEPCTADPCPLYSPLGPSRMALEVSAGTVARYGVAPGWLLRVPSLPRASIRL